MTNRDTINLLKECNKGVKTAVTSFEEVFDNIGDNHLKEIIKKSWEEHKKIGDQTHELLLQHNEDDKEPSVMAKVMSWTKINMKLMQDSSDKEVADLMTDGCNMGIKSLCKYRNQYKSADVQSVEIANYLIGQEHDLVIELREFL